MYFGAVGDNIYDNSLVFNNIETFLNKSLTRYRLTFPSGFSGFYNSTPLTIRRNVSVMMYSPLYTSSNTYGIKIGEGGNATRVDFKLNVVRSIQSDWTDNSVIGIIILNLSEMTSGVIDAVNNFTVGVQFEGDGTGFAYNVISLGNIRNNKYGVKITQRNSGWVNENEFLGGRFSRITSVNNNKDVYGVLITSEDNTYENINNNNFYKPSFEFRADVFTDPTKEIIPIVIEDGQMNAFYNIRDEKNNSGLNTNVVIRTTGNAQRNFVEVGFGINSKTSTMIQDLGVNPSTSLITRNRYHREYYNKIPVYTERFIRDKILQRGLDVGQSIESKIRFSASGGSTVNWLETLTNATFFEDSVQIGSGRAIGVRLNSDKAKRFVIRPIIHEQSINSGARICFRCFDSTGNILLTGDLVKSTSEQGISFNSVFGGVWRTNTDTPDTQYISVDESVKKIEVLFAGGTSAETRFSGFEIYSIDDYTYVESTPILNPKSSVIPSDTSVANGTFVVDSTGGVFGWVLTTIAGTKTWTPVPYPVNVTSASTTTEGLVSQSTAVSDISTADAVDATTTQALVNELKAKINEILATDRTSGQRAT